MDAQMYLPRSFLGFPAMPVLTFQGQEFKENNILPCWAFLEIRNASKGLSRDADKPGAAEPAAKDLWETGTEVWAFPWPGVCCLWDGNTAIPNPKTTAVRWR